MASPIAVPAPRRRLAIARRTSSRLPVGPTTTRAQSEKATRPTRVPAGTASTNFGRGGLRGVEAGRRDVAGVHRRRHVDREHDRRLRGDLGRQRGSRHADDEQAERREIGGRGSVATPAGPVRARRHRTGRPTRSAGHSGSGGAGPATYTTASAIGSTISARRSGSSRFIERLRRVCRRVGRDSAPAGAGRGTGRAGRPSRGRSRGEGAPHRRASRPARRRRSRARSRAAYAARTAGRLVSTIRRRPVSTSTTVRSPTSGSRSSRGSTSSIAIVSWRRATPASAPSHVIGTDEVGDHDGQAATPGEEQPSASMPATSVADPVAGVACCACEERREMRSSRLAAGSRWDRPRSGGRPRCGRGPAPRGNRGPRTPRAPGPACGGRPFRSRGCR